MSEDASGGGIDVAVLEIARFEVRPGTEDEFEAAYRGIRAELVGTPGCRAARLTRGVESSSSYVLLVEWDTLDSHLKNFRESERFVRWRAALGPYFAEPPSVSHGVDIPPGPDPV
ncbi:putative enzyme involved in biosynthesis of extracellular polysaccharides [Frankia canadensis]|uniref:Putative enzyme involved in biosynthesis of extracellular polysaccharides n=1 Tax=Frankia canadensis TaxID=1836972 RepID=A0A2I2KXY1_9ACTN|nr:antibiotic biosynthesis monooxygenase family protein [Frankia canadensis]SNQ50521.1 putative enzyme involved in biosynthesis of extracellular polysaccharides [Frankia canadensis]SOU57811.1 putative enzyme involved in biosynthesis of extracellular polysaccharides [Frankia canadensis]